MGSEAAICHCFAPLAVGVIPDLVVSSLGRIEPRRAATCSPGPAGPGGGGGEAGSTHVPEGATLMTIGPSMANIVQYYGQRKAYGLSVSPNPLNRNPSYEPLPNPDRAIRDNEIQYIVWDAFSAARSPYFASGSSCMPTATTARVVHTETISARPRRQAHEAAIVVYEVRP